MIRRERISSGDTRDLNVSRVEKEKK